MTKKRGSTWKIIAATCSVIVLAVIIALTLQACFKSEDLTIGGSKNRQILNELNEAWSLDDKYVNEKTSESGVNLEWLHLKDSEPQKAILQLHGGAYIRNLDYGGNLYRRMAQQYADISGAGVLTVDYRIAPENPYPAALEDALTAYNYLLNKGYSGKDIIIAGDSAGGGLTLALTLYLRDNGMKMPCGLVTMSAWTNLDYRRRTPAYVGSNDPKDPYISPLYGDYSGFPPMLMQVGTRDIEKDTIGVAQKAEEAGVNVKQTTYNGMVHVFQALFPRIQQANEAWEEVEIFINTLFETNNGGF